MHNPVMGVIGSSKKADERRYPIHPEHLKRIPYNLRRQLVFEEGYGKAFGMSDSALTLLSGGVASRHDILAKLGKAIINKPVLADFEALKVGGILCGYMHCVQQSDITHSAVQRKQTLMAFEDMFVWSPQGQAGRHTFYKNNEMAGYCAVLHALQLKGIDGHYGNQRKTIIFGFGAVSRGAIYALKAHGFRDITICIQRPEHEVREEVLDCHYVRVVSGKPDEARMLVLEHDGSTRPLTELISESDIIINGVFQDTSHPTNFVTQAEADCLKPHSLIIDVSCDAGMGFYFAQPTSFAKPMLQVDQVDYYAVDHTPSYLWESASRSISAALLVYLPTLLQPVAHWQNNETVRRAMNIQDGIILNPAILAFQNRHADYPHAPILPAA